MPLPRLCHSEHSEESELSVVWNLRFFAEFTLSKANALRMTFLYSIIILFITSSAFGQTARIDSAHFVIRDTFTYKLTPSCQIFDPNFKEIPAVISQAPSI